MSDWRRFTVVTWGLWMVVLLGGSAWADSWSVPGERDFRSANRQFSAHVVPAKGDVRGTAEVFRIDDANKVSLWRVTLGNEGTPGEVYLSDDGCTLVTVNEISTRVHGGLGDFVLAFYGENGLIRNYSLEQILHYPDRIERTQFESLFTRSVSGRSWAHQPKMFDTHEGKPGFCIWLWKGRRWLGWDVATGAELDVTPERIERWDALGRAWALDELKGSGTLYWAAVDFLGYAGRDEDRAIIRELLSDGTFSTSSIQRSQMDLTTQQHKRWLVQLICQSQRRMTAERALAALDGRASDEQSAHRQPLYYLGRISGTVVLADDVDPRNGVLWVYLIPADAPGASWWTHVDPCRLVATLSSYKDYGSEQPGHEHEIPFLITGVTPGRYRLKAVLDATPPWTDSAGAVYRPVGGDYQSDESIQVTVEAGKDVRDIVIECTRGPAEGSGAR